MEYKTFGVHAIYDVIVAGGREGVLGKDDEVREVARNLSVLNDDEG